MQMDYTGTNLSTILISKKIDIRNILKDNTILYYIILGKYGKIRIE